MIPVSQRPGSCYLSPFETTLLPDACGCGQQRRLGTIRMVVKEGYKWGRKLPSMGTWCCVSGWWFQTFSAAWELIQPFEPEDPRGWVNVWLRAISWNGALLKSNSETTNRRWGMMRCWAVGPWRIRLTLPGSLLVHKIWTFDHIDISLVCPSIPGPRLIFFTHGVPMPLTPEFQMT